ncbi:TetR/AcrR family transcriptional regulator [Streptomyces sp. NPDC048172]|uniref:TetR/AcrR family transcriptional regulator n=1 Tax=Streptomyces sp. NPDC048172 TaxID=3365505 RepID=UPI003721C0ED
MSRGNTRQRIQDVALELFAEQGYEKTSLREIAERLDVTKAALYYHFKTKEDILDSLFQDLAAKPTTDLIAWAETQPSTLETKLEILRRYSAAITSAAPLFRFMQENQATMRDLKIGDHMKRRIFVLLDLIRDDDAPLVDQVRCSSALFTMHATLFALQHPEVPLEEKSKAALQVAQELVTTAHQGSVEAHRAAAREERKSA